MHTGMLRELASVTGRSLDYVWRSWWSGEVPEDCVKAKVSRPQEEDPGNYRQSILILIAGKEVVLETISKLYKAKEGHWEVIISDQPDSLLQWDDWLGGLGESRGSCLCWLLTLFHNILIDKLMKLWVSLSGHWGELENGWTARFTGLWSVVQRPALKPVNSSVPQGLILGPIKLLHWWPGRTEHTLGKFLGNTKLRGVSGRWDGYIALHRNLGRVQKWADSNIMKFNKKKC